MPVTRPALAGTARCDPLPLPSRAPEIPRRARAGVFMTSLDALAASEGLPSVENATPFKEATLQSQNRSPPLDREWNLLSTPACLGQKVIRGIKGEKHDPKSIYSCIACDLRRRFGDGAGKLRDQGGRQGRQSARRRCEDVVHEEMHGR